MNNTKLSKLLLLWLYSNGHKIIKYEEAQGIRTRYKGQDFRFDISGSYGGYRVAYQSRVFKFYNADKLVKITDLNEFQEK